MCDKIEHIADFVYIKKDRIWDIMDNKLKDNQGKEELFHERSEITKEAIALLLRNCASGPCHF
jgi:hypothetical protein